MYCATNTERQGNPLRDGRGTVGRASALCVFTKLKEQLSIERRVNAALLILQSAHGALLKRVRRQERLRNGFILVIDRTQAGNPKRIAASGQDGLLALADSHSLIPWSVGPKADLAGAGHSFGAASIMPSL
jgi:hypothetical protein